MSWLRGILACIVFPAAVAAASTARSGWTEAERRAILAMSPVPPAPKDETNRFSGNSLAIALGRRLFFSPSLSRSGRTSCASCHDPKRGYSGGAALLTRDDGEKQGRHAPSLLNAAHNRWFFWDGRRDTLWGQALEALTSDMGSDAERLSVAARHPELGSAFVALLAKPVSEANRDELFAVAGKAIAAFVETLSGRTAPFDRYVAALQANAQPKGHAGIESGLRIFLRRGNCAACHMGALFTDGEFHNVKLSGGGGDDRAEDAGRYVGVYLLRSGPFQAAGAYSDAPNGERARLSALQVRARWSWGAFKTPSLRGLRHRTSFMHDGRFRSIEDVIDHYSDTPGATSLVPHVEEGAAPLALTPGEKRDLKAFLMAL